MPAFIPILAVALVCPIMMGIMMWMMMRGHRGHDSSASNADASQVDRKPDLNQEPRA